MVKVALLIGVSEYEPGLNPLPASVKDMQAIAKVLQHPEMGDFAETDIQKLENPDPQKMQEAIETVFGDRRKDDLVVLYFSGHGIKDESGKLYIATRSSRKNPQGRLIKSTAVPASFVHNIMSDSCCKRQVVILDCCFSGAFAEGWSAKNDDSVDIQAELGGEGRVVLTSSTSTQYSFQQQAENLSIYTRYLIEGIETGAADLGNDGAISVDELHEYAKKKVKEAAPAMQPEIYAVKEGFKILLAKAAIGDPKLKYRKEVEIYASRGEISIIGRSILNTLQQNLGLLAEETAAIEAEVLKPYQQYKQKLQQYEQALIDAIGREPTLSHYTRNDLQRYQEILGLRTEDIAPIEARISRREFTLPDQYVPKNEQQSVAQTSVPANISLLNRLSKSMSVLRNKKSLISGGIAAALALTSYSYFVFSSQPHLTEVPTPSPIPTMSERQPTGDPTGTWKITESRNLQGYKYGGAVNIKPTGEVYNVSWKTLGNENYSGLGFFENGHLYVAWSHTEENYGVILYQINQDGTLDGKWTAYGFNGKVRTEKAIRKSGQLEGEYKITGTNLNYESYTGTLNIKKTGNIYQVSWSVGKNKYEGIGLRSGNNLVLTWGDIAKIGVVDYTINGNNASGIWSILNQSKQPEVGTENLVRIQY